jgi:hypothetical protein
MDKIYWTIPLEYSLPYQTKFHAAYPISFKTAIQRKISEKKGMRGGIPVGT